MPLNYDGPYKSPQDLINEFEKLVTQCNDSRYTIAITSNKYQHNNRAKLEKNGFKQKIEFLSSHGNDETLTLWLKVNSKANKPKNKQISLPATNCSVMYSRNELYRICHITIKDGIKDIVPNNFKRLEKTPIWFFIQENKLVKVNGKIKENKTPPELVNIKQLKVVQFK